MVSHGLDADSPEGPLFNYATQVLVLLLSVTECMALTSIILSSILSNLIRLPICTNSRLNSSQRSARTFLHFGAMCVQAGLDLFEMDWNTFVHTPSRYSAGPVDRAERAELLAIVTRDGVSTNYR